MQRIIIDGAAAERIANHVVLSAMDPEVSLRGNNAGNMENGGYIVQQEQDIWYLNSMVFDSQSSITYLQRTPVALIGSTAFKNDIRASIDGILAGFFQGKLLFIDTAKGNLITALDVETGQTSILAEIQADSLHLLGDRLYWSEPETGTIRTMLADGSGSPKILAEHSGRLAAVAGGWLYSLSAGTMDKISITDPSIHLEFSDGPYTGLQVSGAWLFFLRNNQLWRQSIDGGTAVPACVFKVDQYVVNGTWMAASCPAGGITVSRTDGTGITQITQDQATGISLAGNWLFYHNLTDRGRLYAIDLENKRRMAMDGDTLTDGGIKLVQLSPSEAAPFANAFSTLVDAYRQTTTYNDLCNGTLNGEVLFVEIPADGSAYHYHRLVDKTDLSPASIGILVLVSYKRTAIGYYTDGDIAYRIDTLLTVFDRDNPVPKFVSVVEGKPPVDIKHGSGDRTGIPVSWHLRAMEIIKMFDSR